MKQLPDFDLSIIMPFHKQLSEFKRVFPAKAKYYERNGIEVIAQSCGCGCHDSSNTNDNYSANWYKGYSTSIGGGNKRCASSGDVFSRDNFN